MIKKSLSTFAAFLISCARLEHFPIIWKYASIIIFLKPAKNVKNPANHRTISFLNTMSKIFKKIILHRLQITIAKKIRLEQFEFGTQHSTTLQLVNVIDEIANNLNKQLNTVAVYLDVEKAFDKVWHDGITYKLIQMVVPHQLLNLIRSFIYSRTFEERIDSKSSTPRLLYAGVPQGSCLSPHLFSIYINDMLSFKCAKIALFADDTLFYVSGTTNKVAIKRLQK